MYHVIQKNVFVTFISLNVLFFNLLILNVLFFLCTVLAFVFLFIYACILFMLCVSLLL
jgi:hypothetical protein